MFVRIRSVLCNKKAGASVYLGVVLMLLAFVVVTICINVFQMYSMDLQAQLISDCIADGAAIAGQTPLGFDESRALSAAQEIFDYNNCIQNNTYIFNITITDETANGIATGDKLISVTVSGQSNYVFADILKSFTDDAETINEDFAVRATSVVKAEAENAITSILMQSYFIGGRYEIPVVDIPTTSPGNRLSSYPTWLINYYLCPEYNSIYQPVGESKAGHFLLDYLKHMGVYSRPYTAEQILTGDGANFFATYSISETTHPTQIQAKANAGEIVFIVCRDAATSEAEIYIVVPSHDQLSQSQITVAYANRETDNYKIIEWADFQNTHTNIKIYHHE